MNYDELALELHKKYGGKISLKLRDTSELTREKLSAYYTPGVAAVCREIVKNPDEMGEYCWTNNLVAVISDGSAVLGLGDIGPRAGMPVMEGKALLFKHFADVDAVPIVLDVHSADEIVAAVRAIAPSFGAINLEDISAPKCFEVEDRLKNELDIPVMHDDQHGTAIVVLAGLINAMKVTGKDVGSVKDNATAYMTYLNDCRVVVSGAGAAGVAIMRLLKQAAPFVEIIAVDSRGIVSKNRSDLNLIKQGLLDNQIVVGHVEGGLTDALRYASESQPYISPVFIGVSAPNALTSEMVQIMGKDPIIFAMANPDPEIMPDIAKAAGAKIVATGRSDFPNQVNNALAFPGIFRGALDHGVKKITDQHKIAAAVAIASLVANPTPDEIIPSVFAVGLVEAVAGVIR